MGAGARESKRLKSQETDRTLYNWPALNKLLSCKSRWCGTQEVAGRKSKAYVRKRFRVGTPEALRDRMREDWKLSSLLGWSEPRRACAVGCEGSACGGGSQVPRACPLGCQNKHCICLYNNRDDSESANEVVIRPLTAGAVAGKDMGCMGSPRSSAATLSISIVHHRPEYQGTPRRRQNEQATTERHRPHTGSASRARS